MCICTTWFHWHWVSENNISKVPGATPGLRISRMYTVTHLQIWLALKVWKNVYLVADHRVSNVQECLSVPISQTERTIFSPALRVHLLLKGIQVPRPCQPSVHAQALAYAMPLYVWESISLTGSTTLESIMGSQTAQAASLPEQLVLVHREKDSLYPVLLILCREKKIILRANNK